MAYCAGTSREELIIWSSRLLSEGRGLGIGFSLDCLPHPTHIVTLCFQEIINSPWESQLLAPGFAKFTPLHRLYSGVQAHYSG